MPPPVQIGERLEPARARPVPFWRHGLALAAGDHRAGLGGGGAAPAGGLLGAHALVHERPVEARAEGASIELLTALLDRRQPRPVTGAPG